MTTIQLWCLLAGIVLPYVWAASAMPFRMKQFGKVDMTQPRVQTEKLVGRGHGAWSAQMNAWEALIIFAVANLMAFMAGVDPTGDWATAAIVWVAARLLHGIFYIADVMVARVFCFTLALASSLYICYLAFTVSTPIM